MTLIETGDYRTGLAALPKKVQRLADTQVARLATNIRDSRLHTKKLTDLKGVYSFRITRKYRGLFYLDAKRNIILFAIGHRKDIYSA